MTIDSPRRLKQYCSVCKDHLEMPVEEVDKDQNVIWLKCPGCSGILPYLTTGEEESADAEKEEREEISLEDLDVDGAIEYDYERVYSIGDTIYHRSWNDYGKVIAKEKLPGNRDAIVVRFVQQGKIKLRENAAA
jgi:hypothetical protein